jgi:hypothetical protein
MSISGSFGCSQSIERLINPKHLLNALATLNSGWLKSTLIGFLIIILIEPAMIFPRSKIKKKNTQKTATMVSKIDAETECRICEMYLSMIY